MPTPDFTSDPIRRVFVTADDYGRSPDVNAAIETYFRAGALQQASLMVAEPAAATAAEFARAHPELRVGLHLTLCDGRATQPSDITDAAGNFSPSPAWAGIRYAFDPRLKNVLEAEIRRQFERFAALGLTPTYWDGHTHLHMHPVIMRLTIPIAREHGFRFVRLVREPGPWALTPWIFHRLAGHAIPSLKEAGIDFADRVLGLRDTGKMTRSAFERALALCESGEVSEIYFHPGAEGNPPSPDELASLVTGVPR